MALPLLIIVTGLPASGKSTLAAQIGGRLSLPVFGKDQFKELLFDTLGIGDRAWSRQLGAASVEMLFAVIEAELRAGRSCIVESNFSAQQDAPRLRALLERHPSQMAQVVCVADGEILLERFRGRARHPGHLDQILAEELGDALRAGQAPPLDVGGEIFAVDTTDPAAVDLEQLARTLGGMLAR
jgi:predicted kinase